MPLASTCGARTGRSSKGFWAILLAEPRGKQKTQERQGSEHKQYEASNAVREHKYLLLPSKRYSLPYICGSVWYHPHVRRLSGQWSGVFLFGRISSKVPVTVLALLSSQRTAHLQSLMPAPTNYGTTVFGSIVGMRYWVRGSCITPRNSIEPERLSATA